MAADLTRLTIAEAGRLLRAGEVTSLALAEACLARIDAVEPKLNAFITRTDHDALAAARQADADLAAGNDRGPLHGIPVALKDLCATKGVRTTAGSAILSDWVPDFDATVVTKLREGGAVSLGKLNLHEFAYGTTSANEFYGPVRNPWGLDCHPGGSSGGSGAAVASGMCFGAIGSDTGGSIRIPAALCATVGLMPTYGLVSRAGVTPLSWSLDHIGPLTRTVEDAALFLNAIAGYDPADPGSAASDGFDATAELGRDIRGMRVGVVRSQFERIDEDVAAACEAALGILRDLGAEVVDLEERIDDPRLSIMMAEASAYHKDWIREHPEKYSDSVRALIHYGLTISAERYINDLRRRREFTEHVSRAMEPFDALVTPTSPSVTCPIEEATGYRWGALAQPWDLTGQPVISVPCGFGKDGLPVGISFAGRPFEEAVICRVAYAYEQSTPWHNEWPPL